MKRRGDGAERSGRCELRAAAELVVERASGGSQAVAASGAIGRFQTEEWRSERKWKRARPGVWRIGFIGKRGRKNAEFLDSNSKRDTPVLIEAVEVSWVETEAREKRSAISGIGRNAIPRCLAGRRNWQLMAFLLVLINGGLGYGIWYLAHTFADGIYMLDRTGSQVNYAGAIKPTNMDDATWDIVRVEELKKFITSWRTVTSDAAAQKADWDRAFAFVGDGSQARDAMAKWYEANDPLARSGKGRNRDRPVQNIRPGRGEHVRLVVDGNNNIVVGAERE